jgi:hypothetical protein
MQVPTIREVYTLDPNDIVRGKVKMFEVVDIFDYDASEPAYAAYTERDAENFIISWLEGA